MVRALRPRNHPDVVKSTLSTRDVRFNETTIDTILGAPRKISIPERYMPDEVSHMQVMDSIVLILKKAGYLFLIFNSFFEFFDYLYF